MLLCLSVRPALAEWTKINTYGDGTVYVDFGRIRESNGQVYFWYLLDFDRPKNSVFSASFYNQGDCQIFRLKQLSTSFYRASMGKELLTTNMLQPVEALATQERRF